jgi:threonine synthase
VKLVGTRDPHDTATFLEAAAGATPEHGGLFVPETDPSAPSNSWPRFDDVDKLLAMPWRARCVEILHRLIGDELDDAAIGALVEDALDFDAPVVALADGTFALELFHGPTLAFKDFGARFLAAILERVPARGPRTILTATSGDTGAAVAHAFWKRPGVRVVVLYPKGRVSALQERQIACLGGNVTTFAVEGSFDDCQAMVKACFADRKLSEELGLTSANSINIARLVAQVLYYFEGVAQVRQHLASVAQVRERSALVVAVPSGNFGNLCAGLMAWKLGLDVRAFVAATNANDTVPEYLETGVYRPRESVSTLSNAMDVGAPSNWERIEALFERDLAAVREIVRWGRASDADTVDEQRRMEKIGYIACPHTAVGHRVLRQSLKPGEHGLFLATAHPAKFGTIGGAIPPALTALRDQPVLSKTITTDLSLLVDRLRALR